ncbi:MAG TPA: glycoside hydrolase domain-containing protein [Polyangiaceae bacterium]|jgi:hypothetical protein
MVSTLRARSTFVAFATLCASAALVCSGVSCGGGSSGSGAPATDGGSTDAPGVDGFALGDGAVHDGAPGGDDSGGGTGDAGDPCAADTGGTSGTTAITAVWANEGGDKVTQDELRATGHTSAVANSIWDGTCIRAFGAKNEVISFDVVLEAASAKASKVSFALSNLTGPGGAVIRSTARSTDKLFDWTSTEAELFYVRYLQIQGLSQQAYGTLATWQEATFPKRAQCPGMTQATPDSKPTGSGCAWAQRPVANKFYPDIAVPLELVPTFDIAASSNQSIWADVYIPKTAPSGVYGGMVTVSENGAVTHKVPVSLRVRNFALPDAPSAKTMLFTSYGDLGPRYAGVAYPNPGTPQDTLIQTALKNERLMAHRHEISLIGDDANQTGTQPGADYVGVLDGSFFSSANGYAGPGTGSGQDVYSIGTYGGVTENSTQSAFTSAFNGWETWFEANSPNTERFMYLCDEVECQQGTPTITTQLQWWAAINGVGAKLHTMATQPLLDAPSTLSDPTSGWPFSQGVSASGTSTGGTSAADQSAADAVVAAEPTRRIFSYNGQRPGAGSCATEDDGVALREQPWGQYKKKIDRWFWWEATYYDDNQQGLGQVDLFSSANTFGTATSDPSYGTNGGANGNGLFMYPGTDTVFPSSSYGLDGPIASLRLKHWRRGIEDVDYVTLAAAIDPASVSALVDKMVPSVLWEQQCHDPTNDCSYTYAPVTWSDNPDDWEAARAQLAHIIDGQ